MGLEHGLILGLAACLWLAVGSCVGQNQTEFADTDGEPQLTGADARYMVHPTMHRALLAEEAITLFETDSVTLIKWKGSDIRSGRTLTLNRVIGSQVAHKDSSSITNIGLPNSLTIGGISYNYEIDLLKRHANNLNQGLFEHCNRQVFRAYDMARITISNPIDRLRYLAIGISDTHICEMGFTKVDPKIFVQEQPMKSLARIATIILPVDNFGISGSRYPLYRIASVTLRDLAASRGDPIFLVECYDEAGGAFSFEISSDYNLKPGSFRRQSGLTSVILDDGVSAYMNSGITSQITNFVPRDSDSNNGQRLDGLSVMKRHFQHSFVESIAMLEGNLAYSRCLFDAGPVMRFSNDKIRKWPQGLDKQQSGLVSVQAIEGYKYKGSYYYHIFDIKANQDGMDPNVYYWWCRFNRTEDASQISWPNVAREQCRDYRVPYEIEKVPIDVIYQARCSRTYAFYQHMFQYESPDKQFTKSSPFMVVDWMTFPVNAILFHNNRLYLFGPAHRLQISYEIGVQNCDLDQVKIQSEHYQSDLLLMFSSQYDGVNYEQRLPFYDSGRIFDGITADPPLDATKDIKQECRLYAVDEPDVPTGPTTLAPVEKTTPKPKDSTGSSMITIIIIAIIVGCIICGCIYCLYSQPKPVLRDFNEVQNSRKQPASSLSPTLTVRSSAMSQQRPSAIKEGKSLTATPRSVLGSIKTSKKSVRSPGAKTPRASRASKSLRQSPRSPRLSPKSVKSYKSSKSAQAPKA